MTSSSGDHIVLTEFLVPTLWDDDIRAIYDIVWTEKAGEGSHADLKGGTITIAKEAQDERPVEQRKDDASTTSISDSEAYSPSSAITIISPSRPGDKRSPKRAELAPEQKRQGKIHPYITLDPYSTLDPNGTLDLDSTLEKISAVSGPYDSPGRSPEPVRRPNHRCVAYVVYAHASWSAKFDCVMHFCADRVNFNDFKVTAMSTDMDLDCGLWPLELVRMTERDEHGNEFLKLNVGVGVGERPGPTSSREPPRGVRMWAKKRETKLTDEEKNTLGLSGGGSWGSWW